MTWLEYMRLNTDLILSLLVDHLVLFSIAIAMAVAVGMALGILTVKSPRFFFLVPATNSLQSAPDLVLLALIISLLGLGLHAALLALFVKGVLPVLRNTYGGIVSVNPSVIQAARGMGMSDWQILYRIELPLALPVILTGVRVASVMVVSVLTLSAYIGVNSLGVLIARGIATSNTNALLTGSVLTALFAVLLNFMLLWLEKRVSPRRRARAAATA